MRGQPIQLQGSLLGGSCDAQRRHTVTKSPVLVAGGHRGMAAGTAAVGEQLNLRIQTSALFGSDVGTLLNLLELPLMKI